MVKRTDPFPQRRRAAAAVFLDGLVQFRPFKLLEESPALPSAGLGMIDNSGDAATEKEFGLSAKFGDYCGLGFPNVCKTRARKC